MSAALLVQCPSCEQQFAVRIEAIDPALKGPGARDQGAGTAAPAPRAARPAAVAKGTVIEVEWKEDVGWELNCPNHGWSAAKEWPQSPRGPANIQCQDKSSGTWCTVRVPLAEAKRLANVR